MERILIRCDASKKIGLGHIIRCIILADEFKKLGKHVLFAVKSDPIAIEKLTMAGYTYILVPAEEKNFDYSLWLVNCIQKYSIALFIGDVRDGLPPSAIIAMRGMGIGTIAIDEPSDYAYECDLCFYPPHAILEKTRYRGKIYQGFEYVILRPSFRKPSPKTNTTIPNVLLMAGGTDAQQIMPRIFESACRSTKEFKILMISKSFVFPKQNPCEKECESFSFVEDIATIMQKMDIAILTFGASVYEALACGIKSIHICLNQDHMRASAFFLNHELAQPLSISEIEVQLTTKLEALLNLSPSKNLLEASEKLKTNLIIPTILKEFL